MLFVALKTIAVFFLLSAPGYAEPTAGFSIEVTPAWGGIVRVRGWTGLTLSVMSDIDRQISVEFPSASPMITANVDLVANRLSTVVVPYPVQVLAPVEMRVHEAGKVLLEDRKTVFREASNFKWRVDIRGIKPGLGDGDSPTIARVSPTTLPGAFEAYGTIHTLVVNPKALSTLSTGQIAALESYLSRCGKLLVDQAPERILSSLKTISGCGGVNVRNISEEGGQRSVPLPEYSQIQQLSRCQDCSAVARNVSWILIGFGLASVIALAIGRTILVVAIPLLAVIVQLVVFRTSEPIIEWLAWTQGYKGDKTLQTRSVLRIEGRGKDVVKLELPQTAVPALPMPRTAHLTYSFDRLGSRSVGFEITTGFLSRDLIAFDDLSPAAESVIETSPMVTAEEVDGKDMVVHDAAAQLVKRMPNVTNAEVILAEETKVMAAPFKGVYRHWSATIFFPQSGSEETQ